MSRTLFIGDSHTVGYQTIEGEALRDDENFSHIAAWEHVSGSDSIKHLENLSFRLLKLNKRSYK